MLSLPPRSVQAFATQNARRMPLFRRKVAPEGACAGVLAAACAKTGSEGAGAGVLAAAGPAAAAALEQVRDQRPVAAAAVQDLRAGQNVQNESLRRWAETEVASG